MQYFLRLAILPACLCSTAGLAHAASTERVSVSSAEAQANNFSKLGSVYSSVAISSTGRFVAFFSMASNLVTGDTNSNFDVFMRDRLAGTTERISVNSAEVGASGGFSYFGDISPNGRFVAFYGTATNLVPNDTNATADIFVRDRQLGTTERVSVGPLGVQSNGFSDWPSISANGRYVAFHSSASNLVALDTNGGADIFVHDRTNDTTERISLSNSQTEVSAGSLYPSISADGRYVAFRSTASTLVPGDGNGDVDIFVRDLTLDSTVRVSVDSNEVEANDASDDPAISADGRYVVFDSLATNLVTGDTNGVADIFLRDLVAGTTQRISVDTAAGNSNGHSFYSSISADGRFVSFASSASDLVAGDTNGTADIFVRDRQTGVTRRVNLTSPGAQTSGGFGFLRNSISGDGQFVAFESDATNLVPGDTNNRGDVFVRDLRLPNDVLGDFGAGGIHQFLNNAFWLKVHAANPVAIAVGDLDGNGKDEQIAGFGSGVFVRYNNAGSWVRKTTAGAVRVAAGDLDGNGKDEVVADRGATGLWVSRNNGTTWTQLRSGAGQGLAVGDFDNNRKEELAVDFGTRGLWVFQNNATWVQPYTGNPTYIAVGDLDGNGRDDLIADRGAGAAGGIFVRYNNAGAWIRKHTSTSQGLSSGDLDGNGKEELLVDRGATGLFALFNNVTWVRLHTVSPTFFTTADLDSSGKADVVAGFGASGLFVRYNNAGGWTRISTSVTQGLTAGGFD